MTSKDVLKNIKTLSYCKQHSTIQEWCNIIEQDLERLEKLEKIYNMIKQDKNVILKRIQSLVETANPLYEVTFKLTLEEIKTIRGERL